MAYVYIYYDPRKTPLEPIYVGKGSGVRFRKHLFSPKNFLLERKIKSIRKIGLEPIIEKYIDSISDDEAYKVEEYLIRKFGRCDLRTGTLCNLTDGGFGTRGNPKFKVGPMSEETKKKIGDANRGKKRDRVIVEQHRLKLKGRKRSEDAVRRSVEGRKWYSPSDNTKKLVSDSLKKPVGQYDLDGNLLIIYPSLLDAAKNTGISNKAISHCCCGKSQTSGGYKWKYV